MYTLETQNKYVIVAHCNKDLHPTSYVFHSLSSNARHCIWFTDFKNQGQTAVFKLQVQTGPCHAGPERLWSWDPTLGLINDLRAPRQTFPAAALSRVRVLSFVYLFTPINDHIIRFVILLIVCRGSSSDTSGCF